VEMSSKAAGPKSHVEHTSKRYCKSETVIICQTNPEGRLLVKGLDIRAPFFNCVARKCLGALFNRVQCD